MFITLEGIEGSGKSTIQKKLAHYFEHRGQKVLCTREPGGSALGQSLRSILLNTQSRICSEAELFLFLADRAQHVSEVIRPALERGHIVLCDRYIDSTIAYQGAGRGFNAQNIQDLYALNASATGGLMPTITLLLDLPVTEGLTRAHARNSAQGTSQQEGRFDSESVNFHKKVQEQYLRCALAEPERFRVIDAAQTPEAVLKACVHAL